MSIGIIVATEEELIEMKNIMDSYEEKDIYELTFVKGKINSKKVIVVKCGIGKVNAARTTQILIDNFKISKIINIGAAGGINPKLKIQDIVIGEKIVQYDFDTTSAGDYEKGEIQGIGKFIRSDYELINICKKVLEKRVDNSINVVIGTIATADIFCSDPETAKEVRATKVDAALENMNSFERRVIHNKLTNFKGVSTISEGEEPNRHVIIKAE